MEPEQSQPPVSKETFLMIIDMLTGLGIPFWIEGGWGIDVLVGRQTRPHRDIDVDFDAAHEALLMDALTEMGYEITTDWRPSRAELHHPAHGYIDIHPFVIDASGDMRQANPEGGWFSLSAGWFTESMFEGRRIPCVSAEGQRIFHSGYEQREVDAADLQALAAAFPPPVE